jgi:hypothetical protein
VRSDFDFRAFVRTVLIEAILFVLRIVTVDPVHYLLIFEHLFFLFFIIPARPLCLITLVTRLALLELLDKLLFLLRKWTIEKLSEFVKFTLHLG